ncbi:DUF732 domain-containing protein [Nocardia pseudovaccinii]|uniref:DUF732 domain-containing protein n=1 Tax=Nocardia pseudovaccinii TaxID=189540 RepID=UPI003D8ADB92
MATAGVTYSVGTTYASNNAELLRFENATAICYALRDGDSYAKVLKNGTSTNPKTFVELTVETFCPDWGSGIPK